MPNIVDPGPWIRQRIAEETAPLRAQLAQETSATGRLRLRGRIYVTSRRIRRTFHHGGTVKF